MIRFALVLMLASCSMLTARDRLDSVDSVDRAGIHEDGQAAQAHERLKLKTIERIRTDPPLKVEPPKPKEPAVCTKETEDSREEMLNRLDCLLKKRK